MDVIASGALKRPDIEPIRSGRNPRQHRRCLTFRTLWSVTEHDAFALEAGALQNSQSPVAAVRGGDEAIMEPQPFRRWSILLWSPRKLNAPLTN
jgi:hypothetical protein